MLNELEGYSGKRVLIFGDTGFKGSWLSFILNLSGAEIIGYSLPPNVSNSHFNDLNLEQKIKHVDGDIRDYDKLSKVIKDFQPEFVFHLAAQALVSKSYENPIETISTNVLGSAIVLDALRECNSVKSIIYVTSDKCYENKEWTWGYRENDQLGGHDPYSASKACAEIVFSSFVKSYFEDNTRVGLASTRAGNVIGGGDWSEDRLIPDCIKSIYSKQKIALRSPNSTRPWQHVLEPLSGYLLLGLRLFENSTLYSGNWNFGPNSFSNLSVRDVAQILLDEFQEDRNISIIDSKMHEAVLLKLNCDKANIQLNWYPKWNSAYAVSKTAQWYKNYSEGVSAEDLTRADVEEYFNS